MKFHTFLLYSGWVIFSFQIYGNLCRKPHVENLCTAQVPLSRNVSSFSLVYPKYTYVFKITKYISHSELNGHTVIVWNYTLNELKDLFAGLLYGLESMKNNGKYTKMLGKYQQHFMKASVIQWVQDGIFSNTISTWESINNINFIEIEVLFLLSRKDDQNAWF